MKLKVAINDQVSPEDYKLLRTTIATVASLRDTAVLRFTEEELVIISTSKDFLNDKSSSSSSRKDADQLWCHIPRSTFSLYSLISARTLNTISMEYNCAALLSAFKRYDKVISQGSPTNFRLSLMNNPSWNQTLPKFDEDGAAINPMHALSISFEEVVYVDSNSKNGEGGYDNDDMRQGGTRYSDNFDNKKVIVHNFKVPVKLLYKVQDFSIVEPNMVASSLILYELPPSSGTFGQAFHNFMKRIERFSNVNNIRLHSTSKRSIEPHSEDEDDQDNRLVKTGDGNNQLKIVVDEDELHWHLDICWNGPLSGSLISDVDDVPHSPKKKKQKTQQSVSTFTLSRSNQEMTPGGDTEVRENDDMFNIDESEGNIGTRLYDSTESSLLDNNNDTTTDSRFQDISRMVERAEKESNLVHEVIIRARDWKVCSRLYPSCDNVILAISHDSSCVIRCMAEGDSSQERHGEITYFITRSKPLL